MTTSPGRRTTRQRVHAALAGEEPEGGFAIILTLMLILIVAGVTIAIAGVVLSQVRPTLLQRKQVRSINAAEAGLQIAVSQLRTAVDGTGKGSLLALPCTAGAATFVEAGQTPVTADGSTYTGLVSNGPGSPTYTSNVAYYLADPTGHTLAWLSSQAMPCPLTAIPYYAFIQTRGSGDAVNGVRPNSGNRTEHATYQFSTTNTNAAGGRIVEMASPGHNGVNDPGLCMDAGPNPGVGTTLTVQACQALGTPRQTWQYRGDLSLLYGGDPNLALCIQQPAGGQGSSPTLQACTGTGTGATYPYASGTQQKQEWGYNDYGHFSWAQNDGSVFNGNGGECLEPSGASKNPGPSGTLAAAGAAVLLLPCDDGTDSATAWSPDAQVGAGKAGGNTTGIPGGPTFQLVNYYEFGRCLDVTQKNVNKGYMIDYPCKQAPDPAQLAWNQKWNYTAGAGGYGTISTIDTDDANKSYCLTDAGGLVNPTLCVANQVNQQWHPSGALAGNYAASYNLVNKLDGLCMAADHTLSNLPPWSEITVQTCDSSLWQKWNAPPVAPASGIGNVNQDPGSG